MRLFKAAESSQITGQKYLRRKAPLFIYLKTQIYNSSWSKLFMPHLLYLHDIIFNLKKYSIIFTIVLLHTPVTVA